MHAVQRGLRRRRDEPARAADGGGARRGAGADAQPREPVHAAQRRAAHGAHPGLHHRRLPAHALRHVLHTVRSRSLAVLFLLTHTHTHSLTHSLTHSHTHTRVCACE